MKSDIRCAACHLMQITGRAAVTSNNSHFVGSRGDCHCKHPEADAAFKLICPDSGRMLDSNGATHIRKENDHE